MPIISINIKEGEALLKRKKKIIMASKHWIDWHTKHGWRVLVEGPKVFEYEEGEYKTDHPMEDKRSQNNGI